MMPDGFRATMGSKLGDQQSAWLNEVSEDQPITAGLEEDIERILYLAYEQFEKLEGPRFNLFIEVWLLLLFLLFCLTYSCHPTAPSHAILVDLLLLFCWTYSCYSAGPTPAILLDFLLLFCWPYF